MRVLLVNKFYYNRGGDCTAVFGTENILKSKGHEVAIFSIEDPQNTPSPWSRYFPTKVDFSSSGLSGKVSSAIRIFHSKEVSAKFKQILSDFKPDIVHLHNIHSYISPLVAEIAHKKGIRVVWTLHDYKLICPTYLCLRNGKVCEECFNDKSKVFKHKCMKNSKIASLLAWMEACYWNKRKLSEATDMFICPSSFLKTNMAGAGYPADKIKVLHNFLPGEVQVSEEKEDYFCYVGRLSEEKGVDVLLNAAVQQSHKLKIIGGGPLLEAFRERYSSDKIEFYGQVKPEVLYPIVQKARFLVLPSVCYENNPFSVIEALCMGTPVLGSRIGGIPELIEENVNGCLFAPGETEDLKEKIEACFLHFADGYNFGKIATDAQNKFGSESFYNKLINIYDC